MSTPIDRSKIDRLLNAEDPPDVAERGVTYEFLERLLRKQKLSSLTTRQVVKQYVVPQTFSSKCSLSGLLRQISPHYVGRATHYVVHPWDGSFERLVSALGAVDASHDDEEGNPPYFWIDVFALNQRQQVEGYKREEDAWLHRDEMFTQLRNCMRTVPKTVAILDPVVDPVVMKRSWCMFECAQAIQLGRELMLCAVPEPPDRDPFLDVIYDFERALENYTVNFDRSEATIPIDKEWLDKEVLSLSPLGAQWLNEKVGQQILGWLGDRAAGRVLGKSFLILSDDLPQELLEKRLSFMQRLSKELSDLDRGQVARDILEKAIDRAEDMFGTDEEPTLSMRHDMACLCAKHFKEFRRADHELRHILSLRKQRYPDDHPLVIESMEALARVLKERRRLTEAIALFRTVLMHRERTLGPKHFTTLVTMNFLALTLQKREHYKEAESVFRKVIGRGRQTLGETNLDVLVWSNNLAVLYLDTKQFDNAEHLLRHVLRHAEHALGPTHPHTLTLVFNLGYCMWGQKRDRAAEAYFRRELAGCEATKGPDHRDTLRSRQNLARFLARQPGREQEAEAILHGNTKQKESTSNPGSPVLQSTSDAAGSVKKEKRVAISSPEVQEPTPEYIHLGKTASVLTAMPPPHNVEGPRGSSTEWDAAEEQVEVDQTKELPMSDGDDRTADDERSLTEKDHRNYYDDDDESEDLPDEDDEEYDDAEDDEDLFLDDENDEDYEEEEEGDYVHQFETNDAGHPQNQEYASAVPRATNNVNVEEVVENEPDMYEVDTVVEQLDDISKYIKDITIEPNAAHRRLESKDTMTSAYSEEEVYEYDESTLSDSFRIPDSRGQGESRGRDRREQTVTSDDELLAEQLLVNDEADDYDDDDEDLDSFYCEEDEENDYSIERKDEGLVESEN